MMKKLLLLLTFQFCFFLSYAQVPQSINYPSKTNTRSNVNCTQSPGKLSFGKFTGQSNRLSFNEIILCYGDSLELINSGSDLSDDPNTSTLPGIGYALFDCPPSGTSIQYHLDSIITQQPCLNTSPTYQIPNASTQNLTGPFWIIADQPNGNIQLFNQGQLQYGFNNGQPITVWLAPITLDNFPERGFENNGTCAALDPTQVVKVTYLNPINAQEVTPPSSGNDCQSAFVISGGFPELNPGQNYTVNIYFDDAQKTPVVPNNFVTHGDTLVFNVPKPGNYVLEISDGISCEQHFLVDQQSCPALNIILPTVNSAKDSIICLPIAVSDFTGINSIQIPIAWDTSILDFQRIELGSNPLTMNANLFTIDQTTQHLLMSWFASGITTIPDGTTIFEICFKVTGDLGNCTPLYIPDEVNGIPPFFPEITNTQIEIIGWSVEEGEVCVSDNPIYIQTEIDTLTCGSVGPANVQLTVTGGNLPYQINLIESISGTLIWDSSFSIATSGLDLQIPAGHYILSVTDWVNNNNSQNFSNYIPYSPLVLDSIATQSPTCINFIDGRITAYVSGGTAPYRYEWISSLGRQVYVNQNVYGPLPYGNYQLLVTDAVGCDTLETFVTLDAPPQIEIQFQKIKNVSCFEGREDAEIQASATYEDGSSGNFSYIWQSTGQLEENISITTGINLSKGWQTLIAIDRNNNSCSGLDSVEVRAPQPITLVPDISRTRCFGTSDGVIQLNTSGGTGNYNYSWAHDPNLSVSVAANLPSGNYEVSVTDANGCLTTDTLRMTSPDPLRLMVDSSQTAQVSCNGASDGYITLTYNQSDDINPIGTAPYQWENNIASGVESSITQLAPGTYKVTLTDTKGCKDSLAVLIEEPDPLIATFQVPEPPLCHGEPTVFNIDDIQGGNGQLLADYLYFLDSTAIGYRGDQAASLFAGTHHITVVDTKNCQYKDSFLVTSPDPTEVSFNPDFITVALGDEDQRLQPIISHSTPIAFFQWSPEEFLTDPNTLTPGITAIEDQVFSLELEDVNGCTDQATISVAIDKNRLVYIPNVFSPNNDGVNDLFSLHACTGVQSISSVRIFDRWGRMVAYTDESLPPNCSTGIPLWNGGDADEGTYVYSIVVLFDDNFELNFRGEISLIR